MNKNLSTVAARVATRYLTTRLASEVTLYLDAGDPVYNTKYVADGTDQNKLTQLVNEFQKNGWTVTVNPGAEPGVESSTLDDIRLEYFTKGF